MQENNSEKSTSMGDTTGKGHPLEENPNWKGGRTVTSHGYVLVKRPDHPDAHVNGYIYEHRLVAEEKIGRRLRDGEHVHHKNGDGQDNRPENLEVLTVAEHRAAHRESDDLRAPDEPNPTIECGCGCGKTLRKYDETNRPREYLPGHNSRDQESPTQEAVLEALSEAGEPLKREALIERIDATPGAISSALAELSEKEEVERPVRGYWKLPGQESGILTKAQLADVDEEIECACGCGETLQRYDDSGREREFISGHNTPERESPVRDAVLELLTEADGPMKRAQIADSVGTSAKSVGSALRDLRDKGIVENVRRGYWAICDEPSANHPAEEAP